MSTHPQIATLLPLAPTISVYGAKSYGQFKTSHRKEHGGFIGEYSVHALTPPPYQNQARPVVTLRLYQPGQVVYACLWIHPPHGSPESHWRSGSGYAGGYGYYKPSAAAESAITNAGIQLAQPIGGVGENAIRAALLAVAAAIDPDGVHIIHHAHA